MISHINRPFTNYEKETNQNINIKLTSIVIGIILVAVASFFWSGLALVGIGLLGFAFGFISTSILNQHLNHEANWGTVIFGQLVGIGGIIVLLIAYFL